MKENVQRVLFFLFCFEFFFNLSSNDVLGIERTAKHEQKSDRIFIYSL